MEQHPVPQPITSYEFRLVGDMTLKQFGKLASGVILALIVNAINPAPPIFKWSLIIFFTALGFAMAFLPFEGRPIDIWILAFFKRIYSPTQYIWRQNNPFDPRRLTTAEELVATPAPAPVTPPPEPPPPPEAEEEPTPPPSARPIIFQSPSQPKAPAVAARFQPNMIVPASPDLPNLIVGFIHNVDGRLIDGAIIEIRDSAGNPVRALRSNKLGQFQIATPLPDGVYEMEIEKDGLRFDIIKVELKGEIISPIEIVSK